MSLLRNIQESAIDPQVDIASILRKCKVLSFRLGYEKFKIWVDQELNGYNDITNLPDYRILTVQSKGHFTGPAGSGLRNADIPLSSVDKDFRQYLEKSYLVQPTSVYVSMLEKSKHGESLQEPWPPDIVAHVGRGIYMYMTCMTAWKVIPYASLVNLIETVRNKVLSFVLEIELEDPDAGEVNPQKQSIPQDKVAQVFNTQIYGNVGNLSEGGRDYKQIATMNIQESNLESLKEYLKAAGIPEKEIIQLENAIKEDDISEIKKTKKLSPRVSGWLGSIASGIAQGLIPIAQGINANLITQSLLIYYGILPGF